MLIFGYGIIGKTVISGIKVPCKASQDEPKMGKSEVISKYKHVLTVKYNVKLLKYSIRISSNCKLITVANSKKGCFFSDHLLTVWQLYAISAR